MITFPVHVVFAVIFFALINWFGRHSRSFGYYSVSTIAAVDDAPVFNLLYRILAPVVLLVLLSAGLTATNQQQLLVGIWRVTPLVFLLRWGFNFLLGRQYLLHWPRQFIIASASSALSFFAYKNVLLNPKALLPDPATLSNELWLVIIIFIYGALNKSSFLQAPNQEERRLSYIRASLIRYKQKYGTVLEKEAVSNVVEALAYSVLIYESFNRPRIYQWLEFHVISRFQSITSLGPMQVQSPLRITSEESVQLGTRKIRESLEKVLSEKSLDPVPVREDTEGKRYEIQLDETFTQLSDDWVRRETLINTCELYNIRSDYASEVMDIYDVVCESYPMLKNW